MTGTIGPAGPELGLFVLWSDGRRAHERILRHAGTHFDVRRVYEIHWTPELVPRNWTRFFRGGLGRPSRPLPGGRDAEGPILVVTAVDPAPRYAPRATARGSAHVSANFFDASGEFAAWIGGGSGIHGSSSATEAARDLMLLLGTDPETHLRDNPRAWDGRIERIHRDLSGARGWSSPAELFHALNHTVRYVVLRNFEGLPHSLHVGSHEDVDLLTDDYAELIDVTNARPNVRCIPRWGGPYWVQISGQDMWFDVRFVGDHYYDPKWARGLLDRRVWNEAGFFSPSTEDYFESLAYHAVVHKNAFSADYKDRLATMARALGRSGWDRSVLDDPTAVRALLASILERRGCDYRRPRDVNVFYNFEAIGQPWPRLQRKVAALLRKVVRLQYRLGRAMSTRYEAAKRVPAHRMPQPATVRRPGPVG
jgi:hypothetical protein